MPQLEYSYQGIYECGRSAGFAAATRDGHLGRMTGLQYATGIPIRWLR
jgi:hypothetical protein